MTHADSHGTDKPICVGIYKLIQIVCMKNNNASLFIEENKKMSFGAS